MPDLQPPALTGNGPVPMKLDLVAIYGVPVLAGAITAAALLGPGSERAVTGARVYGLMTSDTKVCAVRIHTLAHRAKLYQSVALPLVWLEIHSGGSQVGRWVGDGGRGGLTEVNLPLKGPLDSSATLRVLADGQVIAESTITLPPPLPVHEALAPEVQTGHLSIAVVARRGMAVPPFPERVEVTAALPAATAPPPPKDGADPSGKPVTDGTKPSPTDHPALLAATAEGADIRQFAERGWWRCKPSGCRAHWTLEVTPQAPTVQLNLEVRTADGKMSPWHGAVPVVNGRMWIEPDGAASGLITLRAPTLKEEAFISLVGERGRLWGTRVTLEADDKGFSAGSLSLPVLPWPGLVLTVSSDLSESPNSTITWPLRPIVGWVDPPPLKLLADGLPSAIAAEEERRAAARRPAYGLVLASLLFELFYLWRRGRLTRRRLENHLRGASEAPDGVKLDQATVAAVSGSAPLLWLILLTGGLVVTFAALAIVAAFV